MQTQSLQNSRQAYVNLTLATLAFAVAFVAWSLISPLAKQLQTDLGLDSTQGAVVGSTIAGSPAAQAGLQQGDVILSYNKIPVDDYRHVQRLVAETSVGRTITIEVLRKKQKVQVSLTIAAVPDTAPRRALGQPPKG